MEKGGRTSIVVDELPYQVNKASLLMKIGELVRDKKIDGISDIRDESDKSGMRAVIELKRGENPEVILNNLWKETQLEDTFGMNMVALVDGQPRLLNLKQFLDAFLRHRREVVTRRTVFELRKARERGHVLEGLAVALSNVDDVIALIKAAATPADAKRELMSRFWRSRLVEELLARSDGPVSRPEGLSTEFGLQKKGYRLSDVQAQRILEMRLQNLTALEQDKITSEYKETMDKIMDLVDVLAKPARVTQIISQELAEVKKQYGDERKSEIVTETQELSTEDLIAAGRRGGDAVPRRLHEVASRWRTTARRSAAGAAGRRPRRRRTISSRSCSSPTPTTSSCASPTAGASTGSRSTKCPRAAAPPAASRS